MKKYVFLVVSLGFLCFLSCVPAKEYKALKDDYAEMSKANSQLKSQLENYKEKQARLSDKIAELEAKKQEFVIAKQAFQRKEKALQEKYRALADSYDALQANSSSALAENADQNRALLAKIEKKKAALNAEKTRLKKMQKDLKAREQQIERLEGIIAAKENQMKSLKKEISAALTDFEGKGLTVYRKNGKVHVSMENKLLFSSGSWTVNSRGREAVKQLGKVLAQNPDIHVLIVGHTDDVPYRGSGSLKDNWDLSAKRATAVVRILLQNNRINPKQLTAAGRSKFLPVAPNATAEGRAKNRRIEVILTPEWEKLNKLLRE